MARSGPARKSSSAFGIAAKWRRREATACDAVLGYPDEVKTIEPEEGELSAWQFPALVRERVRELIDGRLDVVSDSCWRTVWLDAGQVVAVVSNVVEERLGEWLRQRGVVSEQAVSANLKGFAEGDLFGRRLHSEGLLDLDKLQNELETRVVAIFARMLPAMGRFMFTPGVTFSRDALELRPTTASFLAAAARSLSPAEVDAFAATIRYFCPVDEPLLRFQGLALEPSEGYLLTRIDRCRTTEELCRLVPQPVDEVKRNLTTLFAAGMIELHDQPIASEAAPSRALATPVTASALPVVAAPSTEPFTAEEEREHEEVLHLATELRQQDFFTRLGVERNAATAEIEERYQQLVRRFHPDRTQESHLRFCRRELAEIQRALAEAREVLIDRERRAAYSRWLAGLEQSDEERQRKEDERKRAREELVQVNLRRAGEFEQGGDIGGAVQLLEATARLSPKPETLLALARLQLRNPMWSNRALDNLRRAVTLAPRLTEGWLDLASYWAARSELTKASRCYERVLTYDPTNEEARKRLEAQTKGGSSWWTFRSR